MTHESDRLSGWVVSVPGHGSRRREKPMPMGDRGTTWPTAVANARKPATSTTSSPTSTTSRPTTAMRRPAPAPIRPTQRRPTATPASGARRAGPTRVDPGSASA
jgi:hypothetical protein